MSERKVLSKYYPPDFDPSNYTRKKKDVPSKLPTVRLMAPFSMKCTHCGEYIYKGRKFNARKQITDEKYYAVPIIRFYIRCTRCSAEITFTTDPKNNDYAAEKGIQRNFEPWREAKLAEETEEERLDRLEHEEAERDPMKELEEKVMDAKTEMAIADKLDEIRTRNARIDRLDQDGAIGAEVAVPDRDLEKERQDAEDLHAARRAFQSGTGENIRRLQEEDDIDNEELSTETSQSAIASNAKVGLDGDKAASRSAMPPPKFTKAKKRKQDFGAALGLKKKKALPA